MLTVKGCAGTWIKSNNKYLILFKDKNKRWETPGGKLSQGETFKLGAERETLEETGLLVDVKNLLNVFDYVNESSKEPVVYMLFSAELRDRNSMYDVKLSSEHIRYKWATLEELYSLEEKSPVLKYILTHFGDPIDCVTIPE